MRKLTNQLLHYSSCSGANLALSAVSDAQLIEPLLSQKFGTELLSDRKVETRMPRSSHPSQRKLNQYLRVAFAVVDKRAEGKRCLERCPDRMRISVSTCERVDCVADIKEPNTVDSRHRVDATEHPQKSKSLFTNLRRPLAVINREGMCCFAARTPLQR